MPARQAWYQEATPFEGATVREPDVKPNPMTLEKFLTKGG
jgi:catechol 2,3-dioxygenase